MFLSQTGAPRSKLRVSIKPSSYLGVRWEIAAKSATTLPIVYDIIFRRALGAKYDAIELPIWIEGGKEVKKIAQALGLPIETAKDISDTYDVILKIIFGPEFRSMMTEEKADRVVSRGTECPLLNRAVEMGMNPALLINACQAYNRSAIENLNHKYTIKTTKRMCNGDPYCENIIGLKS